MGRIDSNWPIWTVLIAFVLFTVAVVIMDAHENRKWREFMVKHKCVLSYYRPAQPIIIPIQSGSITTFMDAGTPAKSTFTCDNGVIER